MDLSELIVWKKRAKLVMLSVLTIFATAIVAVIAIGVFWPLAILTIPLAVFVCIAIGKRYRICNSCGKTQFVYAWSWRSLPTTHCERCGEEWPRSIQREYWEIGPGGRVRQRRAFGG